jgi:hypothetical protein
VPDRSAGLQIELWERGQLWDKRLGLCHIRLDRTDEHGENNSKLNTDANGAYERWITLDAELITNQQGQVVRKCQPTGHSILIGTYVELPSDLTEEESKELTEKLEILHDILDKEVRRSFVVAALDKLVRRRFVVVVVVVVAQLELIDNDRATTMPFNG